MEALDILSAVGKDLPFVAPAFVLIKFIIDIEKRATDVDAKCHDLIERITVMVRHLPVLLDSKVEIIPSTRQVIDRMNEGILDAAALIETYRKQSRVARRLNFGNREKFTACADTIDNCSKDFLMCLQIHQTIQLNKLTSAIPTDEGDVAAQSYVATNGGSVDAIVHDREQVSEFARQEHLDMDDSVMEQLNTNINDSVQENRVRLEGILKNTVSGAIKEGFQNLATEMLLREIGQKFHCVQCDKEFMDHTNGPKACSFHRAEYDAGFKSYPCCGLEHPCEFGSHRSNHHCDYPYSAFFSRCRSVLIDYSEQWASAEDTNLETNDIQMASVSELYHWAPAGGRADTKTLVVTVGSIWVWYKHPYYFNTFTPKQLEEITKSIGLSRRLLIFRASASDDEYAEAEWTLSEAGKITGIRLTAKAATSSNPCVRVCPIDPATCARLGDVTTVSEGGIRSYTPSEEYILPKNIRIGPELSSEQSRPVRTDFKTRSTPTLNVILKPMSQPPLAANPAFAHDMHDNFHGTVSVLNNNPPNSMNLVTISRIRAEYRMVGHQTYAPVKECILADSSKSQLPHSIDPRKSWQINFEVRVPRTEEDVKLHVQRWNCAFMARYQPVRIKLILEDVEGEECSLVLEHVFKPPFPYKTAVDNDLGFFFFDNPVTFERYAIQVQAPPSYSNGVVMIHGNEISVKRLNKAVNQALKSGQSEINMKIGMECDGGEWEWEAYALVDISCRRVYAFKIIIQEGQKVPVKRFGCQGYVLCPAYGESVSEVRPISHATEVKKLPPMEPYSQPEYLQDDTVDDFNEPVPPKILPSPSTEGSSVSNDVNGYGGAPLEMNAMLVSIDTRLASIDTRSASIDTNLIRIADALEKLIGMGRIH